MEETIASARGRVNRDDLPTWAAVKPAPAWVDANLF